MKNLTFFIVMLFSIALSAQNSSPDIPAMDACGWIRHSVEEKDWNSYYTETIEGITFKKMTNKLSGEVKNMVLLEKIIQQCTEGEKEATLLLEGGKSIGNMNAEVICEAITKDGSGFLIKTMITLTPADIELLKAKKIIAKTINRYEDKIKDGAGLKGMFNCFIIKKF